LWRDVPFLSDLVPTAVHLPPTWIPAFDLYPLESIETRMAWMSKAVEGNWLVGFGHDCEIDFARVASDAKTKFTHRPA